MLSISSWLVWNIPKNLVEELGYMLGKPSPVIIEEVTDPIELEKARAQDARFARNWAWFEAHAPEIYAIHRGKCICVAGEELFVADTPEEAIEGHRCPS
jgi:hypothetical protein